MYASVRNSCLAHVIKDPALIKLVPSATASLPPVVHNSESESIENMVLKTQHKMRHSIPLEIIDTIQHLFNIPSYGSARVVSATVDIRF